MIGRRWKVFERNYFHLEIAVRMRVPIRVQLALLVLLTALAALAVICIAIVSMHCSVVSQGKLILDTVGE